MWRNTFTCRLRTVGEEFFENYKSKHHREIMAAPWFNEMVTIFTAVEYYKNEDGELNHHLIAAVSDELSHYKASIHAFNKVI